MKQILHYNKGFLLTGLLLFVTIIARADGGRTWTLDLRGTWQFTTSLETGFTETVLLPGTMAENGKGLPASETTETTHLTPRYHYRGPAWYRREIIIPRHHGWRHENVWLFLERTKPATVYVDGDSISYSNDLCTPQYHDLGPLRPGRHMLMIRVDNSRGIPEQLYASSHMLSEDTQTNWNGIIGEISLRPASVGCGPCGRPNSHDVLLGRPQGPHPTVNQVGLGRPQGPRPTVDQLGLGRPQGPHPTVDQLGLGRPQGPRPTVDQLGLGRPQGSHPTVDQLGLGRPQGVPLRRVTGPQRVPFEIRGQHFYADGHEIFLRGRHDACVWPLTGHCPMDKASWRRYFETCKAYGLNHIRFHSWCPPEACFAVADSMGFYLQPELPFWGDFNAKDTVLMAFLMKEGKNILRTYGHHPSFVMMALGNELWGSIDEMRHFVEEFRKINPRIYYTFGSNYYLGYQGAKEGMDYLTTCRIGGEQWGTYTTHTRGSFSFADAYEGGVLNHFRPNTEMDFEKACATVNIPVISHETGQFQSYPDYREIDKYTGVLLPYNLMTFRRRLEAAGMGDQAEAFHRASGRWAYELYKADMEMDLRTRDMAGFQLLDLQDYPGQGSAYVGLLDAFMDSKGYTTPEEWRMVCSPVVPLLVMPTYCYEEDDTLKARVLIANYGGCSLAGKTLRVTIGGKESLTPIPSPNREGLSKVLDLNVILRGELGRPQGVPLRWEITLSIPGTPWHNRYQIWVYPKKTVQAKEVIETTVMDAAVIRKLERGAKVLWTPDTAMLKGHTVGGLFMTDYWNYRMFKTICENNHKAVSPGTLGILTDPTLPLFCDFPTEEHTNWQWWAVVKHSAPLILDNMPKGYRPLVQVIDNIERNHRLGLVMEFRVGHGSLLVCMSDLKAAAQWPEGRAFHNTLLDYMQSKDFHPATSFQSFSALWQQITAPAHTTTLKRLDNISQY
ncbi:MAG: beta-glycosidase [Prevotellaceae bacterium]|nr:beta-glycosidase [Prevotellaceae bacterium]